MLGFLACAPVEDPARVTWAIAVWSGASTAPPSAVAPSPAALMNARRLRRICFVGVPSDGMSVAIFGFAEVTILSPIVHFTFTTSSAFQVWS